MALKKQPKNAVLWRVWLVTSTLANCGQVFIIIENKTQEGDAAGTISRIGSPSRRIIIEKYNGKAVCYTLAPRPFLAEFRTSSDFWESESSKNPRHYVHKEMIGVVRKWNLADMIKTYKGKEHRPGKNYLQLWVNELVHDWILEGYLRWAVHDPFYEAQNSILDMATVRTKRFSSRREEYGNSLNGALSKLGATLRSLEEDGACCLQYNEKLEKIADEYHAQTRGQQSTPPPHPPKEPHYSTHHGSSGLEADGSSPPPVPPPTQVSPRSRHRSRSSGHHPPGDKPPSHSKEHRNDDNLSVVSPPSEPQNDERISIVGPPDEFLNNRSRSQEEQRRKLGVRSGVRFRDPRQHASADNGYSSVGSDTDLGQNLHHQTGSLSAGSRKSRHRRSSDSGYSSSSTDNDLEKIFPYRSSESDDESVQKPARHRHNNPKLKSPPKGINSGGDLNKHSSLFSDSGYETDSLSVIETRKGKYGEIIQTHKTMRRKPREDGEREKTSHKLNAKKTRSHEV
ncbi:hypothetical protein ACMFMF_005674 [Clarireedia jacksonii]